MTAQTQHILADVIETTDELRLEFEGWCAENGKPEGDACELLMFDRELSSEQRHWLEDFSTRWQVAQEREGAAIAKAEGRA